MIDQNIFNIVVGVAGTLGGWVLKALWDGLKELQRADEKLAEKVAAIDKLVAGEYVRRSEFERMESALFAKLDRIETKIDGKMDKP